MKYKKATKSQSKGQNKDTANTWKKKAVFRGQENTRLRKQNKELKQSRDNLREKYRALKKTSSISTSNHKLEGETAIGHQYSVAIVVLIVAMYQYGSMSLRSCRHSLCCMLLSLGLSGRIPSHNSIRNWLCKCGHYRLGQSKEDSGSYILYVDESIVIGAEKMLLILGIPLEKVSKERALSQEDMTVLYVGASQEWKSEDIAAELQNIAQHKTISYIVSDEGRNLLKSYKILNYIHIEDCTHILAKHLKRIYEQDISFIAFQKLVGKLRKDWNLSKTKSQYMPPTMRGKMRFANIFPCVNWAKNCLSNWDNLSEDVQSCLVFLKDNQPFIQSLIEVEIIFKSVCSKLKNEGFGANQKQALFKVFSTINAGEYASIFIQNCKDYLENLTVKSEMLQQEHLLCSSDIIESYFGKFKAKVNPNNRSGLTEFIFTIATFGKSFSVKEAKKALESVKCRDLVLDKKRAKIA